MKRLGVVAAGFLLFELTSAEGADEWLEARSQHFSLMTNAGKGRAKDILYDLEQLRRLITEFLPAQPVDSPTPTAILVFRDEKSFRPFQPLRDGKPEDWAAFFRTTSFKNFIALRAESSRESVRELTFQQYLHLILSYTDFDYPVWLNNGLSLFYGNAYISEGHAEIGKMHNRHRRVLGEFRSMPVRDLFAVRYNSPDYRETSRREIFDAQSWALVHYLIIGRSPSGPRELGRFMDLLAAGRNELLAFQEATGMPLDQMDSEVGNYIRKSISQYLKVTLTPLDMNKDFLFSVLPPALADARLGQLLITTRRFDEARARLDASLKADPKLTEAYEGLGFLHWVEGDWQKATPALQQAVQMGSVNPMVHYHYARVLLRDFLGDTVEDLPEAVRESATKSLAKTLEVAPDHADAARLYGFLCLFDRARLEEGITVVERALKSHRGHAVLLFILGQLYSKRGDFPAARSIFKNLLERQLDPSLIAAVRRQLDYVETRIR